jgi:5-methyltetrahydrofolate--homocysteine methyltransferase
VDVINLLKERNLRDQVRVIIGGAAVHDKFAESNGADGYAPDAGSAVEWVKNAIKST